MLTRPHLTEFTGLFVHIILLVAFVAKSCKSSVDMRGVSICGLSPRGKGTNIGYLLPSVSFFCVLGLYKVLIICLLHRSSQQVTNFVNYNL